MPLIIFDRDGVINELLTDDGILRSPRILSELVCDSYIISLIREFIKQGIRITVASNQPEVSRGLLSRDNLRLINEAIQIEIGAKIPFYLCLHDESDECECRKPKPGLILEIMLNHEVNPSEVLFIGDRDIDQLAARASGIEFLRYLGQGKFLDELNASVIDSKKLTLAEMFDHLKMRYNNLF